MQLILRVVETLKAVADAEARDQASEIKERNEDGVGKHGWTPHVNIHIYIQGTQMKRTLFISR
jgi:hypothetical protein